VKEVPRPEPTLLALDDDQALSGEHEKVLLHRFRVIEAARPARLEDSDCHAEILEALLREVGRERRTGMFASKTQRAPNASLVNQAASRTFTTNHPGDTGARPEPTSSSRARSTIHA
jgi:hypothetical protein